jgi:integrase
MRGHIVQRSKKKGTWSIVIELDKDAATGKRRQQWLTVQGSKRDAERCLGETLHQLDTGVYIEPNKTRLADYLHRWLVDYVRLNLSPRTAEGYEHILQRYIIPEIGNIILTQLKPEHLQRYYSQTQNKGLSAQTVRHHHTVLHKALETAIEWGLVIRNAADAVTPPRATCPEMQTWNEDEIGKFLEAAKTTPYYALFYTALFTGARRSELLALRWQDIDFLLGQIYINRSLHVLKGGMVVYKAPKSAKGRRTVAMPPSLYLVLDEYRKAREAESLLISMSLPDGDLIFSTLGKPLLPNTVTHAWIKLVRRTGIKVIRFHDTRHTHASLMLKQGIHPKVVQERLGHSTIAITLDTYSHITPGLQEAAAKRFDEAFTDNSARRSGKGVEFSFKRL